MALLQKRDELKEKLAAIEAEIEAIESSSGRKMAAAKAPAGPAKAGSKLRKTRAKRTPLKDNIIAVLKQAGKEGIEPKTIAEKINGTPMQVNAWLGVTGKKLKEIKKLGRGKYAWAE